MSVLNFKGSLKKKHTPIVFPVIEVYLEWEMWQVIHPRLKPVACNRSLGCYVEARLVRWLDRPSGPQDNRP
jgi:hypothetical protein